MPYFCDTSLKFVLEKLGEQPSNAMAWFENNFMKINSDKCKLLILSNTSE